MLHSERAIVSSKGQVVIPHILRKTLGIHAGTELVFTVHKNTLEVQPVRRNIDMFIGCCKKDGEQPISVADIDATIQKIVSDENHRVKKKKG